MSAPLPAWLEVAPGIRLTGDGTAWLPEHRTLVVADIHLGYAYAARRRGGYLPNVERGEAMAARLLAAAARVSATRAVVAGDLRHSTRDVDDAERAEVARFVEALGVLERVEFVAGNHDRAAPGMPAMVSAVHLGDVDITHAPPAEVPERWTVCGHLHPRATVRDETGAGARFPCALVGPRIVVLPAFGTWQGGTTVSRLARALPAGEWRRVIASNGGVMEIG
ncbi:MAG: hypothetical protein WKG32_24150 [Gemmatimonadaceae bacterium]